MMGERSSPPMLGISRRIGSSRGLVSCAPRAGWYTRTRAGACVHQDPAPDDFDEDQNAEDLEDRADDVDKA